MTSEQIYEYVGSIGTTYTDFSKDIAQLMGVQWDKPFKDRVYQCIAPKAKGVASEDMMEVMLFWCEFHKNPQKYMLLSWGVNKRKKAFDFLADFVVGKRKASPNKKKELRRLLLSM